MERVQELGMEEESFEYDSLVSADGTKLRDVKRSPV